MEDDYLDINNFESEFNQYDGIEHAGVSHGDTFEPSFHGNSHIDELYNPHIQDAQNSFEHHLDDFDKAQSPFEIDRAERNMQDDINREKFWENAKHEAEIQAEKDRIFLDDINAKLDIVDQYRELERIRHQR